MLPFKFRTNKIKEIEFRNVFGDSTKAKLRNCNHCC